MSSAFLLYTKVQRTIVYNKNPPGDAHFAQEEDGRERPRSGARFRLAEIFISKNKHKSIDLREDLIDMSLLEIKQLAHSFGDNLLFKDVDIVVNKGEHIGIVGQNGTGKSTFMKICTGQIVPDAGRIVWQKGILAGYLDQYAEIEENISMQDLLKTAFQELYDMEEKMNQLYVQSANGEEDKLQPAFWYQEKLEQSGFYSIEVRIQQVVTGLGLSAIGLEKPIAEMSGGQRAKVILAKLLLEKPDVLLLDEPTNFLDKEHITWLSEYLSGLEQAFLVISHDYEFLEKTADRILDIDNRKITKYYGSYKEFLQKKTLLREDYIRQYTAQQKEIQKTEEFIRKNMAGRKSKMARGRKKQLDRMDRLETLEVKEIRPSFHFQELPLTDTEHLAVRQLSVGYYYPVLSGIDFMVKGGQKVVITGFNGIGKSTLLKTLIGQIAPLDGKFHFSSQVKIGYFSQDLKWEDENQTPIQIMAEKYRNLTIKDIRKQLALAGVTKEHAMQAVHSLSGGEQTKVKLCLLMHTPCNFLILDEPTNHLDVQAKEALKEALINYRGTVLFVSHEELFYRDWVDRVIHIENFV